MGTGVPLAFAALSFLLLLISASSSSFASSSSSSSDGTENITCFLGLGRVPRPAVAFFFKSDGPAEDFGAAEELAETPVAIGMPVVLWHVAKCTGAEDFVGGAEDFDGGAEDFDGAGAV